VYETGTAVAVRAFHVMRGMVVDLDRLDQALRAIADQLDGADLETIRPAGAPAVTVEVFARWLHDRLAAALGGLPGVTLAVRVWESPVAFGGYTAPL
jgi:6-pyruvoyl-tetrahydropterin synthase